MGTASNHVFIYEHLPNGWSQTQSLVAPPGNTYFGRAVGISNDFIVVGSEAKGGSEGEVYVYSRNPSILEGQHYHEWYLNTTLRSVTGYSSYFGHSLDISGHTLVVGAKGFEPGVFNARGSRKL